MSIDIQEGRPPLVRFERRAVEDRAASVASGHYCSRDEDFALITPPNSKDCIEQAVPDWLSVVRQQVKDDRIPAKWESQWKENYEMWKKGEEIPLDGVPIKTWPVLSPAQQKNLLAVGIHTVEDLAAVNDESMGRIGLGARDLKNKAEAWLKSAKDVGVSTTQIASLRAENSDLKEQIKVMSEKMDKLLKEKK